MKLIKRYSNRKLYDTERSCYVTLDEVSELVRGGTELQIVDNRTGEDITSVTLAQIVFEQEKKDQRTLPLNTLRTIIQSPTELIQRLSRPIADIREDAQQRVERIRKKAEQQQVEIVSPLREWLDSVPKALEDVQRQVDERLRASLDSLTHVPDLQNKVVRLEREVERLTRRVGELERKSRAQFDETAARLARLERRLAREGNELGRRVERLERPAKSPGRGSPSSS